MTPVALTPRVMKCFETLVSSSFMVSSLPPALDPHQFAYRVNRSTEDAIAMALHTALNHLEQLQSCARLLFVDFSSAVNTILPRRLVSKLAGLGLSSSICCRILDFLTKSRSLLIRNHKAQHRLPQGCVLSPLLFTLYNQDCTPVHSSNTIIKFAQE